MSITFPCFWPPVQKHYDLDEILSQWYLVNQNAFIATADFLWLHRTSDAREVQTLHRNAPQIFGLTPPQIATNLQTHTPPPDSQKKSRASRAGSIEFDLLLCIFWTFPTKIFQFSAILLQSEHKFTHTKTCKNSSKNLTFFQNHEMPPPPRSKNSQKFALVRISQEGPLKYKKA